jgi:hypothetical protein
MSFYFVIYILVVGFLKEDENDLFSFQLHSNGHNKQPSRIMVAKLKH